MVEVIVTLVVPTTYEYPDTIDEEGYTKVYRYEFDERLLPGIVGIIETDLGGLAEEGGMLTNNTERK
jgi:hypothetical protein